MEFQVEKWLSDVEIFRHLVSNGFRIMDDISSYQRHDLLRKVFKENKFESIDEFIANGLQIDIEDGVNHTNYENPINLALESMEDVDVDMLEYLIKKGCPVNGPKCRDRYKYYDDDSIPLVVAVKMNRIKAVECLLKHGANVDKPVLEAVGTSLNSSLVKILLDFKIDLNQQNGHILQSAIAGDRHTYMYNSSQHSRMLSMVHVLLEAGADPNIKTKRGYTAGHSLLDSHNLPGDDKATILGLLLKFGLDLEQRNNEGETLLLLCASKGCDERTKCLVEAGANVNVTSRIGDTPLLLSAKPTCEQTIKCLIKAGANVNFTDKAGNTPVMNVVTGSSNTNQGLLEYLIDHNADVNARNKTGLSIFDHLLTRHKRTEEPLIFLLSSTEVKLPDNDKIRFYKPYSWLLMSRLIQAGCSSPVLLDEVLDKTISENNANGHQLIVHSDPTFFGQDFDEQNFNHILMDESPKTNYMSDNRCVTSLKTWSVYQLRRHLLEVTGNKSIMLRLKQLPLPQKLLSLVTLECFNVDLPPAPRKKYSEEGYNYSDEEYPSVWFGNDHSSSDDYGYDDYAYYDREYSTDIGLD